MTETIAGVTIPDSPLATEATALLREAGTTLLLNHSLRSFLDEIPSDAVSEITAAYPRDGFKEGMLHAFVEGIKHKPQTAFGNYKADVLEDQLPGYVRPSFVDYVRNSPLED
jgi:hypothetical protein